jgi:hypothetical protein
VPYCCRKCQREVRCSLSMMSCTYSISLSAEDFFGLPRCLDIPATHVLIAHIYHNITRTSTLSLKRCDNFSPRSLSITKGLPKSIICFDAVKIDFLSELFLQNLINTHTKNTFKAFVSNSTINQLSISTDHHVSIHSLTRSHRWGLHR